MNHQLDALKFDNRFVTELPCDPDSSNRRRQVAGACYSKVLPTKVCKPQLISYSKEVAQLFDLSDEDCTSDYFPQVFAGNLQVPGMDPYAMCYGGHQFGQWAGQLGDGRAINLGEVINKKGERWALQLKGAGPTPYSRTADGLAVLRSSVREFLCSEAMHHLGVPTTRALSLVLTGEKVMRDMFYDGNPMHEPGAVVCRVAPSFTRFGNFEILASRGDVELLRKLVHYTIKNDYPQLGEPSPEVYLTWLTEVCRRTAIMMVHWQRVGFVHGVMNTDNMSILGLTIDYGPYGWLENYDPGWTPNTTDASGKRYRFGNQPQIALWNLARLAESLYPLIEKIEPLQEALTVYSDTFKQAYNEMMAGKLGLRHFDPAIDETLTDELFQVLQLVETDMTIFFRKLALLDSNQTNETSDEVLLKPLLDAYYLPDELTDKYKARMGAWLRSYCARVQSDGTSEDLRRKKMNAHNPKYVLRNYLAQLAIDKAAEGDFSKVNELLEVLRKPYDEQPDKEIYAAKRPEWARHRAGCSMLSCSS